jgi:hypothetical protein
MVIGIALKLIRDRGQRTVTEYAKEYLQRTKLPVTRAFENASTRFEKSKSIVRLGIGSFDLAVTELPYNIWITVFFRGVHVTISYDPYVGGYWVVKATGNRTPNANATQRAMKEVLEFAVVYANALSRSTNFFFPKWNSRWDLSDIGGPKDWRPTDTTVAPRVPKRMASISLSSFWTGPVYERVCAHMRRGWHETNIETRSVKKALDAYFKHTAPVFPTVPRSVASSPPKVFWRGIEPHRRTEDPVVGQTRSSGNCFTAFTFDLEVALEFKGYGGFIYRLQSDRIARGTPLAWFLDHSGRGAHRRSNVVRATQKESEVLFPPGYFKVLGVYMERGVSIVDVAYAPDPEYVRKGAVPTVEGSKVVTRTVGGHRLELNNSTLVQKIRNRQGLRARPIRPGRAV